MSRLQKQIYLALLTAMALIIYSVELQIPSFVAIPGVKLGLANLVSLCILLIYGPLEAFTVLLLRIVLGSMLTGQVSAIIFSLCGGLLSLLCMIILLKCFRSQISIWTVSIAGGVCHNIGQLLAASLIVENVKIFSYLPVLIISGTLTGYFIGLCAQFISEHLKKINKNNTTKL